MKLDKPKKITLGILLILTFIAIISITKQIITTQIFAPKIPIKNSFEYKIPNKHNITAQRYDAYEEIFKTEGTLLIYGYTPGALDNNLGIPFHNEISSYIENKNLNIKVIAFKNWKNKKNELEDKYFNNTSSCMMNAVLKNLETYLKFISKCMDNACIIKPNKQEYILISRDAEYIIQVLEEKYSKQD
jgi:hypothetical protein